ncbi:hypothetical protein [Achromobacter sp. DMS1]|uniref:hypothetical protein n=1 Tax=Achromobacter sp. DMS1 TaxID=1688405 RepID=UPI000A838F73|nr:hypothetical protein [Achromobacter sp. DMS1]
MQGSQRRAGERQGGGLAARTRQKKGAEPIYGVEQAAHANAEKLLREAGFIP